MTSTTHKTLRGPRGGIILAKANEELEKKFNSAVFPGGQGGPLDARYRRQGGELQGSGRARNLSNTRSRWL